MSFRTLMIFILMLGTSMAVADEWEKLGTSWVNFKGDKDEIDVKHEGRFVAVKLEVEEGHLEMYNVRISFANGDTFSPDTRLVFAENTRSRTIDLPGEARIITKINFLYKSVGKRGKAKVEVFGKRGGGGEAQVRWDKLGTRRVSFENEKDTIEVTASEGVFTAIRIDVEDGNLRMHDVRVVFGNGESFSPDTRHEFKEGSRSRVIDLPGNTRVIKRVEFCYKSERKKGHATVQFFGRHGGANEPDHNRYPGWNHIGSRVVNFGADKDVIHAQGEGTVREIKVEVQGGDLEMFDIQVTFGNGDVVSPKTRLVFDENTRSRDIDLPGNKRIIKKIEFYYRSKKGGQDGKATVHVFGR